MTTLRALQEAIKDKKKPHKSSILPIIERVRINKNDPIITDDLYVTVKIGMGLGLLDPNQVLVDGVNGTFTKGFDATQIIGLALRQGADANLYVRVRRNDNTARGCMTNIHILYYIWQRIPKNTDDVIEMFPDIEESDDPEAVLNYYIQLMEDMFAILIIGGSDANMPSVDLESDVKEEGNTQVKTTLQLGDKLYSVKYNITKEGSIEDSNKDELIFPATVSLKTIERYKDMEDRLIDFVDTDEIVHDMVIFLDEPAAVTPESPAISRCITGHANKCFEKALNLRLITYEDVERFLEEAIDAYNVPAVVTLVERGAQLRYNTIDRLILASARNSTMFGKPLSSALQNRMMIEMALRGIGFDKPQSSLVASFSPSTAVQLGKIQSTPYWRRICRAPAGPSRGELKMLAREIGMDPSSTTNDICLELQNIDKVPESQLESLASKLQRRRLEAKKTSIGDLVTGRTQKALVSIENIPSGKRICVNENLLPRGTDGRPRKPDDFSDLDMVLVETKGRTYCFTSEDYDALLENRTNPLANDEPLTKLTINEIIAKRNTLADNRLPISSIGAGQAIKQIKAKEYIDSYDAYTRQRTVNFIILASNTYGIPSQIFTEILSNEELEKIATDISRIPGTTFHTQSKQRSLRSFGNTMMELVDKAPNDDDVDIMFEEIVSLLPDLEEIDQ